MKITATNPIWAEGSWTYPGSLRIGDKLMDSNKKDVIINSIEYVNKKVIVFNLQIENTETYFASGIGVHNIRGVAK